MTALGCLAYAFFAPLAALGLGLIMKRCRESGECPDTPGVVESEQERRAA